MKSLHEFPDFAGRGLRLAIVILAPALLAGSSASARQIFMNVPASHFTESVPLGNGRLGGMVFGGIEQDTIVLNEQGMWSGSPQDADREDAAASLPEIRRLLLDGRNAEAEALVNANFTCKGKGSGHGGGVNTQYGSYQVLGLLKMTYIYGDEASAVSNYSLTLDLENAIGRVSFERGGVRYAREAFVSAPDQVFVQRITASRPGMISFDARLERPERCAVRTLPDYGLEMYGELNSAAEGVRGVRYSGRLRIVADGGEVRAEDGVLSVHGADSVTLYFTAATDIKSFAGRKVEDPSRQSGIDMAGAIAQAYSSLQDRHVQDYQRLFGRAQLDIGEAGLVEQRRRLTTARRIEDFGSGQPDPDMAALYFDFGRYLLISASRPGGLPANLQGIWADSIQTPWNGDWHANINVQMNYWPADVTNLGELNQPLFDLIESLQEPGARTARAYYDARGWVCFLLVNPWGFTSPGESASWGSTVSCSAWLCQHLWEHYRFHEDRDFLEFAYPILKGSSLFYLDMLIELPDSGWLVTSPSNSPENAFLNEAGEPVHVCLGPTADMQLLRYLFAATREAASILGVDADLREELESKIPRLAPTRLGSDGRVMEWLEEYPEADPQHRHIAHLWGLFPGDEISPTGTPELAEGARKTLNVRGDGSTGWSVAYKLGMWARLGDGDRALKLLRSLIKPAANGVQWSGGSYDNLFCSHPPFQIDGNLGGAAGIAEMLVQSHTSELHLLPALPAEWSRGSVRGLRARGGVEVDLSWSCGSLDQVVLKKDQPGCVTVRYGNSTRVVDFPVAGSPVTLDCRLQNILP